MEHLIYKITNKVTGKSYIGQTKDLPKRLACHKSCGGGCRYLHNAIKKYGWESFECEILERCDENNVCRLEGKYILLYNTLAPSGYNLALDTDVSREFSEETLSLKSAVSQKKRTKLTKSGFIGVTYNGSRPAMQARHRGKWYGASYNTEVEAAEAYDRLVVYFYGPTARINFVDNLEKYLSEDLSIFFNSIVSKPQKTSRFDYVCWSQRLSKWYAYYPLKNGKYKSLGHYSSEEDAAEAISVFVNTGKYIPVPPAAWKKRSVSERSISRSEYIYVILSPDKKMYHAISINAIEKAFNISSGSLWNSWKLKRASRQGWMVETRIPISKENKDALRNASTTRLWWEIY